MADPGPEKIDTPRPDRRGAFRLLFFALLAIGAGTALLIVLGLIRGYPRLPLHVLTRTR